MKFQPSLKTVQFFFEKYCFKGKLSKNGIKMDPKYFLDPKQIFIVCEYCFCVWYFSKTILLVYWLTASGLRNIPVLFSMESLCPKLPIYQ